VMVQKGSEPGPRQADYSAPVGAQYLDVRGAKPRACFGRFSKEETGPKLVPTLHEGERGLLQFVDVGVLERQRNRVDFVCVNCRENAEFLPPRSGIGTAIPLKPGSRSWW